MSANFCGFLIYVILYAKEVLMLRFRLALLVPLSYTIVGLHHVPSIQIIHR